MWKRVTLINEVRVEKYNVRHAMSMDTCKLILFV